MQKELLTKKNYAAIGEEITHEMGASFISAYHEANPGDIASYTIGRNILVEMLAQPGVAAIRFYNALNEAGQKTLVYIGVDAAGKDIVKKVMVEEDGSLHTVNAMFADRTDGSSEWIDAFTRLLGF